MSWKKIGLTHLVTRHIFCVCVPFQLNPTHNGTLIETNAMHWEMSTILTAPQQIDNKLYGTDKISQHQMGSPVYVIAAISTGTQKGSANVSRKAKWYLVR